MYDEHEIKGYPNHFRDMRLAVAKSIDEKTVTYYVREDNKKALIVNGMILTIHYPDGTKNAFTKTL